MDAVYKGTLQGFAGSWMSGLGQLIINGLPVTCENAPTVRALEGCFGNVIQTGHTASSKSFKGRRVAFSVDAFGILEGFTPLGEFRKMNPQVKLVEYGQKKTPKASLRAATNS